MAITFALTAASRFFILAYAAGATAFGKVAVAVLIVNITAFGALGSALVEIKAILDDHLQMAAKTRYSAALAGIPLPLFSALTSD